MQWKIGNFKKGPLMTLIGSGLIILAVYVFLRDPQYAEMFSMFLATLGALALGLKDPRLPGGPVDPTK